MMKEVSISCPHCRRQYTMKIDPERLQRLKTRATCGRCGKTFDVGSRISAPSEAPTEPKVRRYEPAAQVAPAPAPSNDTPAGGTTTIPDLRDEMEELAREFAEAAARFTPVGVKRPAAVTASPAGGNLAAEPPPARPAVEEPTNPGREPAALATPTDPVLTVPAAATATPTDPALTIPAAAIAAPTTPDLAIPPAAAPAVVVPPVAAAVVAAAPSAPTAPTLSLDAEPAGEEELARTPPTRSRVAAAPRSWLDLADPGLAALQSPPSAGAAALEALLHESDTIALPSPPAAS